MRQHPRARFSIQGNLLRLEARSFETKSILSSSTSRASRETVSSSKSSTKPGKTAEPWPKDASREKRHEHIEVARSKVQEGKYPAKVVDAMQKEDTNSTFVEVAAGWGRRVEAITQGMDEVNLKPTAMPRRVLRLKDVPHESPYRSIDDPFVSEWPYGKQEKEKLRKTGPQFKRIEHMPRTERGSPDVSQDEWNTEKNLKNRRKDEARLEQMQKDTTYKKVRDKQKEAHEKAEANRKNGRAS